MDEMEHVKVRMADFYVDPELAGAVRAMADELDVSVAQLCRSSLRLLVELTAQKAVLAASMGVGQVSARSCVVCRMPRRPDLESDAMAHAQCTAILARLGEEMADA